MKKMGSSNEVKLGLCRICSDKAVVFGSVFKKNIFNSNISRYVIIIRDNLKIKACELSHVTRHVLKNALKK